jgi:YidC/Oxa1 family membrane protein insertase
MWDMLIINPMINILLFIYSLIQNFGIAIILFTLLIRLITHPLTVQQLKSTQKMQELQKSPEFLKLQKDNKDDKQKLQQEQMRYYQEKGINPLGGCLPTLIQFPIIIGLYQAIVKVLATAPMQMAELSRHVYPFIDVAKLIPVNQKFLWMDLGQPERLYIFGIGIPVLAVLVVVTTYVQSKLMTPPGQPGEQGAQMGQMMNLYMPFFMGYLALTFAAGLSVYFITSNVISVGQYAMMGKVDWKNLSPKNLIPKLSMPKLSPGAAQIDEPKKSQTKASSQGKPPAKSTGGKKVTTKNGISVTSTTSRSTKPKDDAEPKSTAPKQGGSPAPRKRSSSKKQTPTGDVPSSEAGQE